MRMSRLILLAMIVIGVIVYCVKTTSYREQLLANILTPAELYEAEPARLPTGLLAYWAKVRFDPTFSVPSLDITEYSDAVSELEKSVTVLQNYYSEAEYELLRTSLFPINYLSLLPELEQSRRAFVENPTFIGAWKYRAQLKKVTNAYKNDILKLQSTLAQFDGKQIAFITGYTSASHISQTFSLISSNVTQLEKAERALSFCLYIGIGCPSSSTILKIQPALYNHKTTRDFSPSESEITYYDYFKNYYDPTPRKERNQPLIVTNESYCFLYSKPVSYRLWWPGSNVGATYDMIRTTAVSDVMLQITAELDNPYHEAQAKAGLPFDIQDTSPYFCIDYSKDIGQIGTSYFIYEHLKQLTPNQVTRDEYPLSEMYKTITRLQASTTILHVSDISDVIRYFSLALERFGEPTLVTLLGKENYLQLYHYKLLWDTQSAYATESLRMQTELTNRLEFGVLPHHKIPIDSMFITRGYFSSLFQTNNKSFVGTQNISFIAVPEAVALKNFGMKSLHNDIKKSANIKKFENQLEVYVERSRAFRKSSMDNQVNSFEFSE